MGYPWLTRLLIGVVVLFSAAAIVCAVIGDWISVVIWVLLILSAFVGLPPVRSALRRRLGRH